MRCYPTSLLAIVSLCLAEAPMRAQFQITELPPIAGASFSLASAINNSGQVAGRSGNGVVLWTPGVAQPQVIPNGLQVFSMNDNGHMSGQPFSNGGVHSMGGYYDGTSMKPIAPPSKMWVLYSPGINNSDAIVGQVGPSQFEGSVGYLWQNGSFTLLQPLPGDLESLANAVNDQNVVVGTSIGATTFVPVRWVGGVPQFLGTLGATNYSSANAINSSGVIVGQSNNLAFIWDEKAGMRALPLPDGSESSAFAINNNGDVLGTIDNDPALWKLGPQGYSYVKIADQLPPTSGWTSISVSGLNDHDDICGSGYHNGNYRGFLISTPTLETAYVSRDDPTLTWAGNQLMKKPIPVYAGKEDGDLVQWDIKGAPQGATFTWSAIQTAGLSHAVITGPSGVDQTRWSFTAGGLTWAPGTYHVKCQIKQTSGDEMELTGDQEVGWRTAEYVVVGQIRPINDYDLSLAHSIILNQAIVGSYIQPHDSYLAQGAKLTLLALPPSTNTHIWMAFQYFDYLLNGSPTPTLVPLRGAQDSDKYWMTQTMLDDYPDLVELSNTLEPSDLVHLQTERSYRMFCHTLFRYRLTAQGAIDPASVTAVTKDWDIGPTKFAQAPEALRNLVVTVRGTEFDLSGNSEQSFISSETGPGSGGLYINANNTAFSLFISGRIGIEGRVPNFALFGRDAPYIFTEVITAMGPDGRDTGSRIRLSVDQRWFPSGTVTGNNHFNEIRIYKRDFSAANYGKFVLVPGGWLEIKGQLPAFLASGSSTWPGPAVQPTGN